MALPVPPHPDAAPRMRPNRVPLDVITAGASSDPCLEFLPEEPEKVVVRQPVFIIVPVSSEPPSYAAQSRPHDQLLTRSQDIPADVGLFRTLFRRVLSAPRRVVVGTLLALHHGVMGRLLALRRSAVGALLALHHGMVGTLMALRRSVVGTLLALHHGVMGTLLALHRGVMGALLALRRSVVGALLALHHGVVGTLLALHVRAVAMYVMARRTAFEGARWTWRSWAGVIAGATSIGVSGISRFRRLGGDVRMRRLAITRRCDVATTLLRARLTRDISTIKRFMSMARHHLSVVGRSLYERRGRVRVPLTNVRLAVFAGGTAVCALVMWMFGVQPDLPRLIDGTDRSVAPATGVVASEPSADDSATVHTATSGTSPGNPQTTAPSSVSASMVVMSSAMTVTSAPAGARVTINGIGWGETPVTIRHLPPGEKVVRVTKEGYESQQRIIRVADDRRSAAVRVTLRARS
jgi:hypothetical protein